jgi:hypothetical protein
MSRYFSGETTAGLAFEQASWAKQIDLCLQGVAQRPSSANGLDSDESAEGWQLIERALRMGADVLRALP